jgi:hypothetical protein
LESGLTHSLLTFLLFFRAAEIYVPLRRELFVAKKQLEEVHIALEMNTTSLQTQQEGDSRSEVSFALDSSWNSVEIL